ncbi:hypothetical protein [Amycolatopsis speibonae]|uniref:Uncharacterized protein n=1 Tax=Amycolatopsis speibonae TaxID=1450224 RepID=A0ABV7PDS6_9PSEU
MRFRPQWLRRVLHLPYVPTLGPVHPDTFEPEVFDEVLSAAAAGVMLAFDKESRWSATESETVLTDEIVHRPDLTIIPALSRRGKAVIKTYVYSQGRPDIVMLREATRRWRTAPAPGTSSGSTPVSPPPLRRGRRPLPGSCSRPSTRHRKPVSKAPRIHWCATWTEPPRR